VNTCCSPPNAQQDEWELGSEGSDEWDLPATPKGMRWATNERWLEKYDAAEEMLDAQLAMAAARLMKRL